MPRQMSGKVCIVTGASSGIGEVISTTLAARGAAVALCGRDTARLKLVVEECIKVSGGHSGRFIALSGDLNKPNIRKEIVDRTVQRFGRLDVLIANAGMLTPTSNILTCSEEEYDMTMNTNVKSVAFLIQAAVPHLEKTKGNIVSVSSIMSTIPCSPFNIYGLSKASVDYLTTCLAVDLGAKGIRINTVCPSFIPTTKILRTVGEDKSVEISNAVAQAQNAITPLEHRGASKEDIAEAILFLASDAAGFVTGECLNVDGGRRLAGPFIVG